MELNAEVENIKNIKQKNNLDEDSAQIGSLFVNFNFILGDERKI